MDMSESISKLTAALAKAQGEFKAVPKLGKNPFLKSDYVRLDDIIAAIRGPLSKNGIAWTQPISSDASGLVLETLLLHDSGEWMSCTAPIPQHSAKGLSALQGFGVSLSYMRRYMLTTMLGINSGEDTDGNGDDDKKPAKSAAKKPARKAPAKKAAQKKPPAAKAAMHEAMADAIASWTQDTNALKGFWAWAGKRKVNGKPLTNPQVHEALNVERLMEFAGNLGTAKSLIDAWVAGQSGDGAE